MAEFEVRPATPDDAPAIRQVARETWHAAYDDVIGPDAVDSVVDEWYGVAGLRESIQREDGLFLVADRSAENELDGEVEPDGEVVGFAQGVLADEDEPAWLPRIYVHPDRWGEGVGSELLGRVEAWLRDAAAERLRLAVMADNEVGNAFYEKHGYEVVEERDEEVLGAAFEEYVREKEL